MITRTKFNGLIAVLPITLLLLAAPSAEADWFGISVGDQGFGLSVGVGGWDPYGSAWNDPSWSLDYNSALSGYGEWIWVSGLGRVWHPYVSADWRPYTYGRWVYTSMGWTWVSYEPWGYVPHHYGNWAYSSHGWVWAPGYDYTPASVIWMHAGGYVGWYSCPPAGWSHAHRSYWRGHDRGYDRGFDRGYGNGYRDGYWDGWDDAQYATWVQWNGMASDNVAHHAVAPARVISTVDRHAVRATRNAPNRTEVSRRGGAAVREVALEERMVRAGDRSVRMVRPEGVSPSIERNAHDTVRRALDPELARKIEGGAPPAGRSRVERDLGRSLRVPDSDRSTKEQATNAGREGSSRQPDRASPSQPDDRGRGSTVRPSAPSSRSFPEPRELSRGDRVPSPAMKPASPKAPGSVSQDRFQPRDRGTQYRRDSSIPRSSAVGPKSPRAGSPNSPPKGTMRTAPQARVERLSPSVPGLRVPPQAEKVHGQARRAPATATAQPKRVERSNQKPEDARKKGESAKAKRR